MQNAWFDGPVISAPGAALADSPLACCKACFAQPGCSVWTYCAREQGCALAGGAGAPERALPPRGCRLVALAGFHPVVNKTTSFRVMGEGVPFVSGAATPALCCACLATAQGAAVQRPG